MTMKILILSEHTKEEAACIVADRLRRHAEGPLNEPATWRRVAAKYPVEFVEFHRNGSGRGEFASTEETGSNYMGVIAINTAYPSEEVARAWIHELAHCDLHIWTPPQLRGGADLQRYEGHTRSIKHEIARLVEGLVLND